MMLGTLKDKTVAILGYGNQGRAHALNLRDSGVHVVVGARFGRGAEQAMQDGFSPVAFAEAAEKSKVMMFLFPDHVIPSVYEELSGFFSEGQRSVGFAHGYAYHFNLIKKFPDVSYFLVGPKGAGAVLRARYLSKEGLPGVVAVESRDRKTWDLASDYAAALGLHAGLVKTSFKEETECDLFGEQAVLCGGLMELMHAAFETLVKKGFQPEMAFYECCYEVMTIMELWLKHGPGGMSEKISPTAFFGGITRGPRIISENVKKELDQILSQIQSGEFSKEWAEEVEKGRPRLLMKRKEISESLMEKMHKKLIQKEG